MQQSKLSEVAELQRDVGKFIALVAKAKKKTIDFPTYRQAKALAYSNRLRGGQEFQQKAAQLEAEAEAGR